MQRSLVQFIRTVTSQKYHVCAILIVIVFIATHLRIFRFDRGPMHPACVFNSNHIVPKIIHQSWKTRIVPKIFLNYRLSWKRCYPDWKHILWTDHMNRLLVEKHFRWFLDRYDALPHPICKADVVRYMYMYVYGGIYTDLDTECLRPFSHLLNHSIVLGAMTGDSIMKEGHIQNSFMYSIPKHPFWLTMLEYVMNTSRDSARPEYITGPNALMNMLLHEQSYCPKDIRIYPSRYFNPFSWLINNTSTYCKGYNKMTKLEYLACKETYKDSYVIQFHAHTWE